MVNGMAAYFLIRLQARAAAAIGPSDHQDSFHSCVRVSERRGLTLLENTARVWGPISEYQARPLRQPSRRYAEETRIQRRREA